MKAIIGTFLFLVAMFMGAGIVVSKLATEPTVELSNDLTIEETKFDFGEISMKKGIVEHDFKIVNKSGKPIIIESITTSCMCTEATLIRDSGESGPFGMPGHGQVAKANQTLEVGEEAVVRVAFDPNAHGPAGVGLMERSVSLKDGNKLLGQLFIRAMVSP